MCPDALIGFLARQQFSHDPSTKEKLIHEIYPDAE
jgi:hypothetical protein